MKRLFKALLITLCVLSIFTFPSPAKALEKDVIDEKELSDVSEAGTYPVRVHIQEGSVTKEKIIYVTIVFPNTVVSKEDQEAIDAHGFEVKKGETKRLSNKEIIKKANARAWNTQNGENIRVKVVAIDELNDFTYEITFATERGTSTKVTVREVDEVILKSSKESYYSSTSQLSLYSRYIIYGTMFIMFLIPFIVILIMYKRLSKLYKETEELLYEE